MHPNTEAQTLFREIFSLIAANTETKIRGQLRLPAKNIAGSIPRSGVQYGFLVPQKASVAKASANENFEIPEFFCFITAGQFISDVPQVIVNGILVVL